MPTFRTGSNTYVIQAFTGSSTGGAANTVNGVFGYYATPKPATDQAEAHTGTLSLSGSGTVTSTAIVAVTGTADLSGSGAAGETGSPGMVGATTMSGSGTAALAGQLQARGQIDGTGAGTATTSGVPRLFQARSLTGSGTLSSTAVPRVNASTGLTSEGTLSGTGVSAEQASGSVVLFGLGELAVSGAGAGAGSIPGSGSGNLSCVALPRLVVAIARTGDGTLTGTGTPWIADTVSASGTGTLSFVGSVDAEHTGHSVHSGQGVLQLAGRPQARGQLTLAGTGGFTGEQVTAYAGTLTLSGVGSCAMRNQARWVDRVVILGVEKGVSMPAATTPLKIEQGADYSHGWAVRVDLGAGLVDIDSTWTARAQVRAKVTAGEILHTLDAECTDDGAVVITVDAAVSSAWEQTWKSGVYDLEIESADGEHTLRVAKGSVSVSWEVTR